MAGNKPTSVVVIPSWYPPRGGAFFREHSIALAGAGMDVRVLAGIETGIRDAPVQYLFGSSRARESTPDGIMEYSRMVRRIPLARRTNSLRWVSQVCRLYEQYAKLHGHPDIIQVHSSIWGGLVAAWINRHFGIPFVITEHRGRFTYNGPEAKSLFRGWHYPLLDNVFRQAAHIVTVSKSLQKGVFEICPGARKKTTVIPNMTNTDFFSPAPVQNKTRKPFTFLCVAGLEQVKGQHILLKAFDILQKKDPDAVRLVIGGDGPEAKKLQRMSTRLRLNGTVSFTGHLSREQLREQLRKADAFVLPSLFEAFGIVLIEAMACGLPVIATRSGGPGEIITRENGLTVQCNNSQSLAGAMETLMRQYGNYDREFIRNHTRIHYSRHAVINQYIDLYKGLTN